MQPECVSSRVLSKLNNRDIVCILVVGFLFLSSVVIGLGQSPSLAQYSAVR